MTDAAGVDKAFYDRVDAHIDLSNAQHKTVNPLEVCTSMNFASARYSAWISAKSVSSRAELEEKCGDMMAHFVSQYQLMLQDNIKDYIDNYETHLLYQTGK